MWFEYYNEWGSATYLFLRENVFILWGYIMDTITKYEFFTLKYFLELFLII